MQESELYVNRESASIELRDPILPIDNSTTSAPLPKRIIAQITWPVVLRVVFKVPHVPHVQKKLREWAVADSDPAEHVQRA